MPSNLIEVLRKTLERLEEHEELNPNDPAVIELKRHLLRIIAELEIARLGKAA
jgi:hypothetical protein